jgi:hypothetical protein
LNTTSNNIKAQQCNNCNDYLPVIAKTITTFIDSSFPKGYSLRVLGEEFGLPEEIVWRHPFPGSVLGVRIIEAVDAAKVAMLQGADAMTADYSFTYPDASKNNS